MSGHRLLREARRDRAARRGAGGLRTLGVLVGLLGATLVAAAVLGPAADRRRTGETPATIVSQRLQVGGGKELRLTGFHLRYTYQVGGRTHVGAAFRTWSNVEAARPKVCYDPADPNHHLLVPDSEPCGG